jgi:hypothetical protein
MAVPVFPHPNTGLFVPTQAIFDRADGTPDVALHSIFATDKYKNPDLATARANRAVKNKANVHPTGPPLRSDLGGKSPLPPHTTYRQDLVHEAVRGIVRGQVHPEMIDPVHLHQTQSGITLAGVSHYVHHPDYWETGDTFADQHQSGNRVPIVYERTNPSGGHRERFLLSGHHRAAAAVGLGSPLLAHIVHAP